MLVRCLQQLNDPDVPMALCTAMSGVTVLDFSCMKSLRLSCGPSESEPLAVLFCRDGELLLSGESDRNIALGSQEILLLSSSHSIRQLCFSDNFQGLLVSLDPVASREGFLQRTSLIGNLAMDLSAIAAMMDEKGGYVLTPKTPCSQATFATLCGLSPGGRRAYSALKAVELLYLLHQGQITPLPPTAYYDLHQVEAVRQVRDDMMANLSESHTIAQLAARHHLSQTVLKGCFRALYGSPLHTYLRQQRLELAARLLTTTALPVIQIASDVGYRSVSQFGQAFRMQYGTSPSHYRRVQK